MKIPMAAPSRSTTCRKSLSCDSEGLPPLTCANTRLLPHFSNVTARLPLPSMPASPRCLLLGISPSILVMLHFSNSNGLSAASLRAEARSAGIPCVRIWRPSPRRATIKSTANGDRSIPNQSRPRSSAAKTVVPHPQNGSSTTSPEFDDDSIIRLNRARGF